MLEILLDKGRRADRKELDDFFYSSPETIGADELDHSFYVMYRYSTTGGILKTFLVCKKPQKDFTTFFSFLTFVRADPNTLPDVIRESQGLILKI